MKDSKWYFLLLSLVGITPRSMAYVSKDQVRAAIKDINNNEGKVDLPEVNVASDDRFATLRREADQHILKAKQKVTI